MLEKIAQQTVDHIYDAIKYDVIITNEDAIVIGASDQSRIGEHHEGSLDVLQSGDITHRSYTEAELLGTKHGVTIPIVLSNKIIGTIGITGKPKDVGRFSLLVKRQLELIMRENLYLKATFRREHAIQTLVKEIFIYKKKDQSLMETYANEIGYDLNNPYVVIIIQTEDNNQISDNMNEHRKLDVLPKIKSVFNNEKDLCTSIEENKYIVLHYVNETFNLKEKSNNIKVKSCMKKIQKKLGASVKTGIGRVSNNIYDLIQSYNEAEKSLLIGGKFVTNNRLFDVNDISIEVLLSTVDNNTSKRFTNTVLKPLYNLHDWSEISRTIKIWCETGFSPIDAAKELNIHRNTLFYRLDKINKISGLNIRCFRDALNLYIGIIMELLITEEFKSGI